MGEFKIKILGNALPGIKFSINFQRLNIRIINEAMLPGPIPGGDPDMEITLELLSGDLSEIFYMATFAAIQKTTFTLH